MLLPQVMLTCSCPRKGHFVHEQTPHPKSLSSVVERVLDWESKDLGSKTGSATSCETWDSHFLSLG